MTQHVIRLITEDNNVIALEPCGTVVRAIPRFSRTAIGSVDGVKIISTSFRNEAGQLSIVGLTEDEIRGDTIYIVSTIAAQVIRRPNVVSPATIDEWVVRYTDNYEDAQLSPFKIYWPQCCGQVFGVRALQSFY
jgi:hypothetical protein